MNIKERINKERIIALKESNKIKKDTLSFALSNLKNYEIDILNIKNTGIEISDEQSIALIKIIINQKKESIGYYEKLGKESLILIEKESIAVLTDFLPKLLSEEDLDLKIKEAIKEVNATTQKDFASVMKILKVSLLHKADMALVTKKVKEILS